MAQHYRKGDKVIFTGWLLGGPQTDRGRVREGDIGVVLRAYKEAPFLLGRPWPTAYSIKIVRSGHVVHSVNESFLGRKVIKGHRNTEARGVRRGPRGGRYIIRKGRRVYI